MKVQGITPEYVRSTQAAGFKDLDCDELIGAKVQGVTPEFIEKARKHGFQNLTLEQADRAQARGHSVNLAGNTERSEVS